MDFTFTESQDAVRDAASAICQPRNPFETGDSVMPLRDAWFDRDAWKQLASSQLLTLPISEQYGGSGTGFLEACTLFIEVGRNVVRVPIVWSTVAAMAIERFGTPEQSTAYLPGVATGDSVLTLALVEPGYSESLIPETVATRADGGGWRVTGEKALVPFGDLAERVLVPARIDDGQIG